MFHSEIVNIDGAFHFLVHERDIQMMIFSKLGDFEPQYPHLSALSWAGKFHSKNLKVSTLVNLKACTFERLALISLGFGRGAQVGKISLMEVEFTYGASVDVGRIHFFIWYASGPGTPPKPSIFGRRRRIFFYNAKRR